MIRHLGLAGFFLLHRDMLELAREVAVEVRGTDTVRSTASARARARLERRLDRLLPHRPLAHRPAGQRASPRPLPQRGPHGAAGHRPRLPARHPRGADPARARALRPRPLRPRGGVRHLPGALRGARLRQGAGVATWRDRAAGAHGGPVAAGQRHRARRGRRPGGAGRLAALEGAGSARATPRPGCPATSPSTPAAW